MTKKLILMLLILAILSISGVSAQSSDDLKPVDVLGLWPAKASWLGQKVVFLRPKMHQNVSYLHIFQHPLSPISGIDQLTLGKTLVNRTFVIKGLFQQNKAGLLLYFWQLTDEKGTVVWVKDTSEAPASDQPFVFDFEVIQEKQQIDNINKLIGKTLWFNRNMVASPEFTGKARHLDQLTITGFKSDGPFSETYLLSLETADGETATWKVGMYADTPVYNHSQFQALLMQRFFVEDPQISHPKWSDEVWAACKNLEVALGWDKDMVMTSWGLPSSVQKTDNGAEKWSYGNKYLLFKDKTLVKIRIAAVTKPPDNKPPKTKINDNLTDVAKASLDDNPAEK
jgi:hypothetical protein